MRRPSWPAAAVVLLLFPAVTSGQEESYPLETRDGLTVHNVSAEPVTHAHFRNLVVRPLPSK